MFIYIIIVLILIVITALFFAMAIKTVNLIKKAKIRLFMLENKLEETYYFSSRNNQLLSEIKSKQDTPCFKFDYSWCENNTVICHALGEIDNVLFTECKEAFEKHYNEGCRVFELDFSLTSDNMPVVIHDWNTFNDGMVKDMTVTNSLYTTNKILTNDEFAQTKILGKYTTLTLDRFISLAEKYKDAYFIISTKSAANIPYGEYVQIIFSKLFQKTDEIDPEIKKRYILHAYSFDYLKKTMQDFSFTSAVYRCLHYPHPLALTTELKRYGIGAVTIPRTIYSYDQCNIFHDNGIKIIGCVVGKKTNDYRFNYWKKFNADMLMTPLGGKINEKI